MELLGRSPSHWKTQGIGDARSTGYPLREAACRKYHWHKRKAVCGACGAPLVLSWPQVTVCWTYGAPMVLLSCKHHVAGAGVSSAGFSFDSNFSCYALIPFFGNGDFILELCSSDVTGAHRWQVSEECSTPTLDSVWTVRLWDIWGCVVRCRVS